MKKILFPFLLAVIIFGISSLNNKAVSQTIYFCESVDKDGYPIGESTVFNIGSGGGFLKVLTRMPYEVNTSTVRYEIYKVSSSGSETYDNTIYQDVQTSWVWFWKEITFYSAGSYNIYVYDGNGTYLTSSKIKIQVK